MNDAADIQEYAVDQKVFKYLTWGPNTIRETKAFIRKCIKEQSQKPRTVFNFAVVLKKENKVIGGCRISNSPNDRRGNLGYCLNRKYWGCGYATECAKTLIKFGFNKLQFHRITTICRAINKASARVMQKAGMTYESHFRKHAFVKGAWCDSFGYAIINPKS